MRLTEEDRQDRDNQQRHDRAECRCGQRVRVERCIFAHAERVQRDVERVNERDQPQQGSERDAKRRDTDRPEQRKPRPGSEVVKQRDERVAHESRP